MKKKRSFAILSVLAVGIMLSGCGRAGGNGADTQSVPGMLSKIIKEHHPSPFTKLDEKTFDAKIAELTENWVKLSEEEDAAYYAARELVASLGDEHTSLGASPELSQPELPFFAMPYEGRWLIVQAQNGYAGLVGKELTAVGGVELPALCEKLRPLISSCTEEWVLSQCGMELRYLRNLKAIGVTDNLEKVTVTVADLETGEKLDMELEAVTGYDYQNATMYPLAQTLAQSRDYYATRLDDGTIFIQYNVCAENPQMPMKDFVQALEAQSLESAPSKIIVDLRHNTGGDSSVITPLLDSLKKYQEKGSVLYCLIGSDTFSSGVMNAVDLQQIGAVLTGAPTGGVLGFGEVDEYALPDGTVLYCSTNDFSGYGGSSGQIVPELTVEQTVADFLAGKDTAVELLKNR